MATLSSFVKKNNFNKDLIFKCMAECFDEGIMDCVGEYGADIHNRLFNWGCGLSEDAAEKACNSVDTWSAIRLVVKYEQDQFGDVNTKIEPSHIANMVLYIYGEFLLRQSEHLHKKWNDQLTRNDVIKIKREIRRWMVDTLPTRENKYRREFDGLVWDEYELY